VGAEIKRLAKLKGDAAKEAKAAGTARWPTVSPGPLLDAIGRSRHPGLVWVLAAARDAGASTDEFRRDHPWPDRQGPHPPPHMPAFSGGIPRPRPGEEPHDLPGEEHKDG